MLSNFGIINFWTYFLGVTLIILAPGPETMFVIKTSIKSGVRKGFSAILSIVLSDVLLVFMAWCGLAAVISSTPFLFNTIKYAGAAYLFYLGVQTLYSLIKPKIKSEIEETELKDDSGIIGQGMLVTLLNPKTLLFHISFFSQFINIHTPHIWIAFIILTTVMLTITLIYLSFLVFCGAYLVSRLKGNRILSILGNMLIGFFFIGFAAKLLYSSY